MKKSALLSLFLSVFAISICYGQLSPVEKGINAISPDVIKSQLGFIASDWTEGRMVGERGEFLAADYIASMLQLYGVKPGGDIGPTRSFIAKTRSNEKSYFQNFSVLKTSTGEKQILKVRSSDGKMERITDFTYNVDFSIRPSYPGIEIDAPVVFAGYGLINNSLKYNDFSKLDVKGKFVLKISGLPDFMAKTLDQGSYTSMIQETELKLKEMGAVGIIQFNPGLSFAGNPEPMEFMNSSPSELYPRPVSSDIRYLIPSQTISNDLIRITVSSQTANEILRGSGIDTDDYIMKANSNQTSIISPLTNKNIYLKTTIETSQVRVRNIIGVIEGKNPDQIIVLGAHYDHMGMTNGYIWNGADDNGSGTVGVMTLARAIMETGVKPEKTIIIALWTGEEEGFLGSRYFIQNLPFPLKNIKLNMNFDMISRYFSDEEPDKVVMPYTSSLPQLQELTSANLKKLGINLRVDFQPSPNPVGASDETTFINAGIPIIRIKTVHRKEYHTPDDELSTIDWDLMEKIVKISFANIWELANKEW